MKRASRCLSPRHRAVRLRKFSVMDIETGPWKKDKPIDPFLLCYFNGVDKEYFDGPDLIEDFLVWYLTKKHRNEICFGHNAGRFDFLPLMNEIIFYKHVLDKKAKTKFTPKIIIMKNGSLLEILLRDKHNHRWVFRDSMSILPYSVAGLTKSFDVVHKKWSKKRATALFKKPYASHLDEWREYCMVDCIGVWESLEAFRSIIEDRFHGAVGRTIASTAMTLFRLQYLKQNIPNYPFHELVFRQAYYGGRNEIYNQYAPPDEDDLYYYYDVKSMYPYIMRNNKFPTGVPSLEHIDDLRDLKGRCGILYIEANCDLNAPDICKSRCDYIPILPYRDLERKKLLFPTGRWYGYYEASQVYEAWKNGYEIKVKRAWMFDESEYIFKDYVDDLYKLKQSSTGALTHISKLLMNCFSPDTDIFTEHGPRRITDVKVGDRVYSIDPKTLKVSLKKVERLYAYPYKGDMVRLKQKRYDFLITPNHRLLLKQWFEDGYSFRTPVELCLDWGPRAHWSFPPFNPIEGVIEDTIHIGANVFKTSDWLEFVGWYISEGYLCKCSPECYQISFTQKNYVESIERLLGRMGFKHSDCQNRKRKNTEQLCYVKHGGNRGISVFHIHHKVIYEWLERYCGKGSYDKHIPEMFFILDHTLLESLFAALMVGDGNCKRYSAKSTQMFRYNTVSRQQAEDFQRLCIHLGFKSRVMHEHDGKGNAIYRVFIYRATCSTLRKGKNKRGCLSFEPYDGSVHCITVKDNHTVLAGRGGNYEFVGQSLYGKFAEHRERNEVAVAPDDNAGMKPWDEDLDIWTFTSQSRASHVLPAIGCRVTALAQLYLFSYMQKVVHDNGWLFYTDTDSICSSTPLPSGKNLGDMELKFKFREGIFLFPKTYAWMNEDGEFDMRYKGLPLFDMEGRRMFRMKWKDFENGLFKQKYKAFAKDYVAPATFKTAVNRHQMNQENTLWMAIEKKKSIRSAYNKRHVLSGFRTKPLNINRPFPPTLGGGLKVFDGFSSIPFA